MSKTNTEKMAPETQTPEMANGMKLDVRVRPIAPMGNLLAFANVTIGGCFKIDGFRICSSEKGLYVNMPATQDKGGNWKDVCWPVTAEFRKQLNDALIDGYGQAMLSTPECMKAVAKKLLQYKPQNVVIDPVMYAKNGCPLMNPTAVSTLIDTVIPLADVLTPNIPEAEKIADMQISTVSDMEAAARKIYAMGCKAIVVKGGHHIGNAVDVLFNGENFYHFETSRIDTKNTHGTGCTFSSAIASQLAKGKSVPLAVESAKAYVTMAIEHSLAIGKGCGPTHHFYELYQHGLSKE